MHTLTPHWPAPPTVKGLVTTRLGGVSLPPYDSFNLAQHVGDDPNHVAANRQQLRNLLPNDPIWLTQVHGTTVVPATAAYCDHTADASYSTEPNQVCAILTADCLPIFFCTRQGDKVALAHAGWRGLAAGIVEKTLQRLSEPAENIIVWLGPCIGPQAFEVGADVLSAFIEPWPVSACAFKPAHRPEHWLADLPLLARLQLERHGIRHISGGQSCTYHDHDHFYSYRRQSRTGRMASLLWLTE